MLAATADAFGFGAVPEMLSAIDAVGKNADVIAALVDQRMLERHGDLIDPRARSWKPRWWATEAYPDTCRLRVAARAWR